jgi:hypothetical protein
MSNKAFRLALSANLHQNGGDKGARLASMKDIIEFFKD